VLVPLGELRRALFFALEGRKAENRTRDEHEPTTQLARI